MNMQSETLKFRNSEINRNIWLEFNLVFCWSGHQMSVAVEIKTFGILFDFDFRY